MPFVQRALVTLDEFSVFTTAVGTVGDLSRAIGKQIGAFAAETLSSLLAALSSPVLHRSAKPTVVSSLGDIAMALEEDFAPYLESVMGMLNQAGQVKAENSNDMAMQDFVWAMRESISDAFTGIVAGYHANRECSEVFMN